MPAAAGRTLSHYRLIEKIGEGGMGAVWKAEDERLKRHVAIKILPSELVANEDRRLRFLREARAAAAVTHPNIATIYETDEAEGIVFIAMELVTGKTLRERLTGRPLPLKETLRIATEVVEGLARAHQAHIVHRDLKPENIMVEPDGRAKILDFGLAKLLEQHPEARTADLSRLTTLSGELTQAGKVLGTAYYMSPEQARGEPVDTRSDLFALGIILYEMVAGRRPFQGRTATDVLSAIIRDQPPPPSQFTAEVPPELERILWKCLEKAPEDRYQDTRDLLVDLKHLKRDTDSQPLQRPEIFGRETPTSALTRISGNRRLLIGVGAVVVIGLLVGGYFYWKRVPAPIKKEPVVLADFANTTGDATFDVTLQQALRSELAQWPFLNILSDKTVEETLRLMVRPANQAVDEKIALEICERTGGKAVLAGSVSRLGDQYLVGLKGINCTTGDVLAQATGQAGNTEEVLKSLRNAASSLRGRIGESLASIQDLDPPPGMTTSSLEALRAYEQGERAKSEGASISFYKRAIQLDPDFARAYLSLGILYGNQPQYGLSAENIRKAYDLRDRVSERERLYIAAMYFTRVTGELEKALPYYEQRNQIQPSNCWPIVNMGMIYLRLGNYDKAVTATQDALRLCPENVGALSTVMDLYRMLNRLDDAEATYRQVLTAKPDSSYSHEGRVQHHMGAYWLAFLNNDIAGMKREPTWAVGAPGWEDTFLAFQAATEAFAGHLATARELSARAVESARRAEKVEAAAVYEAYAALWEAESGNVAPAREMAASALTLASVRLVEPLVALVLARAGDLARAQQVADGLEKRFPLDTLTQEYWLPTIRAAIEIGRNHPAEAVTILRTAIPYELSGEGPGYNHGSLFPIYVRGQAFLLSGHGKEAAAEFQKILDRPGMVLASPQAVGARIGLARAYALQGETAKARAAYRDFLTLWKNADPDIPLLRKAKSEYERLK